MKKGSALLLSVALALASYAEIKLPYIMSDGMVLQRETEAKIYGKATPGAKITVAPSWTKQKSTVTAASDSTWLVKVATPEAGGPYKIQITDGRDKITLSDVLIGEVWFCSGQSNMEMPMMGFYGQIVDGANEVIAQANPKTPIRMFLTDKRDGDWTNVSSRTPNDDIWGRWYDNSPENMRQASATGYYFAKFLQETLDIPVAIIVSTKGGAMIEPFMSAKSLSEFPDYDTDKILDPNFEYNLHIDPCVQYNARLYPLRNFTIRGFIWYQGEGNVSNSDRYARLMELFVENDVRGLWGNPDMPFYFVEIAPYDGGGADHIDGALVREAQLDAARRIPNCGIASTADIGDHIFIHPTDKATVGQRLALLALHDTYGRRGFVPASPRYERMQIQDGKIYIGVSNAPDGLWPFEAPVGGFEIAGEDGVWHEAIAKPIYGSEYQIEVWSPDVPRPKNVRYQFHNYAPATVFNTGRLPLHPFRTDR